MKSKKILFIIPSLQGGGAERVTANILNAMDKNLFEPSLILFQTKSDYMHSLPPKLPIAILSKKYRWDFFKLILCLRQHIKLNKPDVVVSALFYANLISIISVAGLRNKPRLIIAVHNYPGKSINATRFAALKQLLVRYLYRYADKIIVVSKCIKEYLIRNMQVEPSRIEVIYNPVPIEEIKRQMHQSVSKRMLKKQGDIRIIAIGRLTAQKRIDRLLRAFARVRAEKHNVSLVILGQGEMRAELDLLSKKLGISSHVNFAGFQANPYEWLSNSDLFVLSSDYEGFPMVILESMVCGVPVLSTNCPSGPDEVIDHGETGYLVPLQKDCEGLAEGILFLINNPELAASMAQKAIKKIGQFDLSRVVQRYQYLFQYKNVETCVNPNKIR